MSLIITLTPEETAKLNAFATARNQKPEDAAREAILDAVKPKNGLIEPTQDFHELLARWMEEDKDDDPEEAADDILKLKKGLNANRRELGDRLLFPDLPE